MEDLFGGFLKTLHDLHTKQTELAAVWCNKAVVTGEGRTSRLAPDNTIRVENMEVVDVAEGKPTTHKIIGCIGTLYNQFELTCIDLTTGEPVQIKI